MAPSRLTTPTSLLPPAAPPTISLPAVTPRAPSAPATWPPHAPADPSLAARTLLIGWPGQHDEAPPSDGDGAPAGWETACLHSYLEAGGQQVVYVGEREECIDAAVGSRPDGGVRASASN